MSTVKNHRFLPFPTEVGEKGFQTAAGEWSRTWNLPWRGEGDYDVQKNSSLAVFFPGLITLCCQSSPKGEKNYVPHCCYWNSEIQYETSYKNENMAWVSMNISSIIYDIPNQKWVQTYVLFWNCSTKLWFINFTVEQLIKKPHLYHGTSFVELPLFGCSLHVL